jgi:hypothetical protein
VRLRLAIWVAIAFVVVYTLLFCIFLLTECSPIDAQWNQLNPTYTKKYHCVSINAQVLQGRISGGFMVFTDFYSVTLPAILIFRLALTRQQRIALIFVFGVGYLYVATSVPGAVAGANCRISGSSLPALFEQSIFLGWKGWMTWTRRGWGSILLLLELRRGTSVLPVHASHR